jgi:protein TonB
MRFATVLVVLGFLLASIPAIAQQAQPQRPGNGVTTPKLLHEVKPQYTKEAQDRKIEGTVLMSAVVREDGTVSDVKVTRSLDAKYGLDEQAVKAARQWTFEPGTKDGKPVPVTVTIELAFTLK